jgi:two-component system nitrate/nitrite response regulator NarL
MEQQPTDAARARVVIADDDELIRLVLAARLGAEFECVGMAIDATQAIALAAAVRPDAAILDVNMPGGGAIEATRQIRTCSPETAIVILSVDETWVDLIELLEAGAMTYLRKGLDDPTLNNDLRSAISTHCRIAGLPHELFEIGSVSPLTAALAGLTAGAAPDLLAAY